MSQGNLTRPTAIALRNFILSGAEAAALAASVGGSRTVLAQTTSTPAVPASAAGTVDMERRGDVRLIGINRPQALNRLDPPMPSRRTAFAAAAFGVPAAFALWRYALADDGACATNQSATNATLLERYVAAVNGNDDALRREIFAEPYIQHGGIKGLRNIFPDLHLTVEDRIFGGDRVVARNTWTGTHRGAFLGIEPTGKQVTFNTIDIWRVERGKFAEHWDVIDLAGLQKQLSGT